MVLVFLLFMTATALAQNKTVNGTVTDQSNLPLPGVNVVVKGTTLGTQTDFDGNFSINADIGQVLVFSYLGQKTEERSVGTSNTINVQMVDDAQALEEVVVVAYGSQTKKKVVSSISTIANEAIKDVLAESPQDFLQGQASGVQVVSSSGILGSAPVIKIRGVASITSGGRPLFVIDGVPLGDNFLTANQGAVQGLNPLASINPNDIESISVLKSASATAVYGSRGSNGVVLVTTKRGSRDGNVKVSLDVSTSFSQVTDNYNLLNGAQFRDFVSLAGQNGGGFGDVTPADLPQTDFDWISAVFRNAVSTNYNVSVSGGGPRTNYFIGGTFQNQEGILVGNNLDRTSIRANITSKAKDWLTVGTNMNVSLNVFDRTPAENAFAAPYTAAGLQRPFVLPRDDQGNFVNTGQVTNVLAQEALNLNLASTTRITGNVYVEIEPLKGLKLKSDLGVDRTATEQQSRNVDLLTPGGFASNSINQQNRLIFTNTLAWAKQFNKHNINILGGISYEEDDNRNIAVAGTGFLSDDLLNVESASTFTNTFSSGDGSRLFSMFARGTYDYDNGKYVVEGSLRRDGSSRFGANNQFGVFWSAAFGWNIADEAFLQDVNWIKDLKFKASYGTAGNNRIGRFQSLGTFRTGTGGIGGNPNGAFNGNPGLAFNRLQNPDLRWESSTTYDFGLSASFFNRRLTISGEYYNKTTDDLILAVPIRVDANLGQNSVFQNIGELENRGVDVDISSVNIDKGGFKWTTNFNIGFNTNEITSLPETSTIDPQGRRFVAGSASQRAIEGESLNTFYLIRFNGVNPQTGDAEWLDFDGNTTTTPTAADRVIVGDANPDFTGGLRNNFSYKNWDLSTLANFQYGNEIFLFTRAFIENPINTFNKTTRVLDIWQNPGDNTFLPSASSPTFRTFAQRSTQQLEDGSYLRLKNVTLGYRLPQDLLAKTFINSVRFYASATNLFIIKSDGLEGFDPEITRSTGNQANGEEFFTVPQATTVTFGVNVSF